MTRFYENLHQWCFVSIVGRNWNWKFGQNSLIPEKKLTTQINSQKIFGVKKFQKTSALAFKQEGCKFKNDHFPLMYLTTMWAHNITSAEPWSVANKVFQIFIGYIFLLFALSRFLSLFPHIYLDCLKFTIAKKYFSQEHKNSCQVN